ncbi:hypothetical protein A6A04_08975 [Paramagnetospirillum marisnigri]|uniref:N-acetyltransferase domain-containing protein n=1 Tax=Paramagnetospirillum marisnigri TaxID=1285242 RepID=A0A178M7Y7_9PROT|nr:hypothetical protein [Paramagnetospirillum marisnigri]OAN44004.1 hypothetical protein A6A04_08975 [Paramagnetospirillum marisnigri]
MIIFEPTSDFDPQALAPAVFGGRVDLLAGAYGVYVKRDDKQIGAMAFSAAQDGIGHDLVVRALAGSGAGLVDAAHDYVMAAVLAGGFEGARAFTHRPGAMHHLTRLGWREIGRTYRITP